MRHNRQHNIAGIPFDVPPATSHIVDSDARSVLANMGLDPPLPELSDRVGITHRIGEVATGMGDKGITAAFNEAANAIPGGWAAIPRAVAALAGAAETLHHVRGTGLHGVTMLAGWVRGRSANNATELGQSNPDGGNQEQTK